MSAGSITQRLFTYIPDNILSLSNANYVRRFSIANNWCRLRIGALVAINYATAQNLFNVKFFLGISSSRTGPMSSYDNAHFVGAQFFPTSTATYNANSGSPCFTGNVNIVRRILNFTQTTISGATGSAIAQAGLGNRVRRTPLIVDFTRPQGGGGSWTVTVYGLTTTTVAFDFRPDHLLQAIDNWGTPTIYGQAMTSLVTSAAVPDTETQGEIDQFDLYWNKPPGMELEVYALGGVVLLPGYYSDPFGGAQQNFGRYAVGTLSVAGTDSSTWSAGTILSSSTYQGTWVSYPVMNGTVGVIPYDSFNTYGVGTIYSDIGAPDGGFGWIGAGTTLASY